MAAPTCSSRTPTSSNFLQRSTRAEVPANVDGIKTSLLAYDAAFDVFGPGDLPPNPRPKMAVSPTPMAWVHRPDWDMLGWSPDGDVRGTYWVKVNDAGTDFTVYGAADIDGNGTIAMYTATRSINTVFLNRNDTY